MDKESTHERLLRSRLTELEACIPEKYRVILMRFIEGYRNALGSLFDGAIPNLLLFLDLVEKQFHTLYIFEPYHQKVRHPIDYYRFGLDFIRPLIDEPHSRIFGQDHLDFIQKRVLLGENAILLANHQTEPDPQAITILLEKNYPTISEHVIYVAGDRVISDPLAIPFSMGCDLLCIYSKRYIDYPPELKGQKQLHNKNTMEQMSRLLREGGKIIYVAPSGGRDRKNAQGEIAVAPFDSASVEMFYLMAKKAKTPTHFIPLALATYDLLPPPETIQKELGEIRTTRRTPVFLSFAAPFDMEMPDLPADKSQRREQRAERIWKIVNTMHATLCAVKKGVKK